MPAGFHKPGEGPPRRDDDRRRDEPPRRRDDDDRAGDDRRGGFRQDEPYRDRDGDADRRRPARDGEDRGAPPRIGRGYGTRHTAADSAREHARRRDDGPDLPRGRQPGGEDFDRGRHGPAYGPPPREGRRSSGYDGYDRRDRGPYRRDDDRERYHDRGRHEDDGRAYDRLGPQGDDRGGRWGGNRRYDDRYRGDDRRWGGYDDHREDPRDEGHRGGGYRPRDRYDRRDAGDRGAPSHYRGDRGYGERPRYQNPRDGYRYDDRDRRRYDDGPSGNRRREDRPPRREDRPRDRPPRREPAPQSDKRRFQPPAPPNLDPSRLDQPIRLNKFIARSTPHSRRESDELVRRGRVTVNGEPAAPGMMVVPGDVVLLDERPLHRRDHLVYILVNKPRGVEAVTAAGEHDPDAAYRPRTLADVLKFDGTDVLAPVGPLAADMLGLQLVSNDARIAEHFARHAPKETYTLTLAEPGPADLPTRLLAADAEEGGVELLVAEYADDERLKLSLVTRRGFPREALAEQGVAFERADRLHFAGLTKKDLPRGHWRFLSDREVTWVTMYQQ